MFNKKMKILYTFLALIGVVFYQFYFIPRQVLPTKLLEIEQVLARNSLNLVQNRVSLVEIVNLNAASPLFGEEKGTLLAIISNSNSGGLEKVLSSVSVSTIIGLPIGNINLINNEIINEIPNLLNSSKEIYERQQVFLKQIKSINSVNENIYNYSPLRDLGDLSLECFAVGGLTKYRFRSSSIP